MGCESCVQVIGGGWGEGELVCVCAEGSAT